MFVAIGKNGERVTSEEANKHDKYFCPCCNAEVVFKKGEVIKSHFAHKNLTDCDSWYEMSEWHLSWQRIFPKETREVVLEKDGEKHRADIFIKHPFKNLIIEFQNSPISKSEIEKRNKFYSQFGELLWVFNFKDKHINGYSKRKKRLFIEEWNKKIDSFIFEWKWCSKTLPLPVEFANDCVDFCFEILGRDKNGSLDSVFIFPFGISSNFNSYSKFYVQEKDLIIGEEQFINRLRCEFKRKISRNDARLALWCNGTEGKHKNKRAAVTFGSVRYG